MEQPTLIREVQQVCLESTTEIALEAQIAGMMESLKEHGGLVTSVRRAQIPLLKPKELRFTAVILYHQVLNQ